VLPPQSVVPVKTGHSAKLRLAHLLDVRCRNLLVVCLLRHVTSVLSQAGLRVSCVVSGPVPELAGAQVSRQRRPGLNQGISESLLLSGLPVLVVASDMPWMTVESVLRLGREPGDAVIARTRDEGTGALLLRRPLEPSFGPRSALAHAHSARSAGLTSRVVDISGLDRDLDDEPSLRSAMAGAPAMTNPLVGELRRSLKSSMCSA